MTTTVTLDGSKSSDSNGNPLTYGWSIVQLPDGSTAQLTNPTTVNPTITIDKPGTYVLQLVVNDGVLDSAPSLVTISTVNSPPVAVAGPDQKVTVGKSVQLDGSGSYDVDGDQLTYHWTLSTPTGSNAALSDRSAVRPTFTPDMLGTYVAELTVNDGKAPSAQPAITKVTSEDIAPVANAGAAQTGRVGTVITLDGTKSYDADGQSITYSWSLLSRPDGSTATLSDATVSQPTFTIDKPGTYVAQLIVSDGYLSGDPSTVTVNTVNTPPVANAGPDQQVSVGTQVQLDGSHSTDVDGDTLTYAWAITSRPAGSSAQLVNANTVNPKFTTDQLGDFVVQVTVDDGQGGESTDTVTITSNDVPPIANPGTAQRFNVGTAVVLDGSASKSILGLLLTYKWCFVQFRAPHDLRVSHIGGRIVCFRNVVAGER